jgi:hypothetical protein
MYYRRWRAELMLSGTNNPREEELSGNEGFLEYVYSTLSDRSIA